MFVGFRARLLLLRKLGRGKDGRRGGVERGLQGLGLGVLLLGWAVHGGGAGCLPAKPKPNLTPSPFCPSTEFVSLANPTVTIYPFANPGAQVNALNVDWVGQPGPGAGIDLEGPEHGCFFGGRIAGPWDPSSSWDTYHHTAGVSIDSPSQPIRVKHVHVQNYGDGISIEPDVPCLNGSVNPWAYVHSNHLEDIHDDAIESDGMCAMEISDNLLERVYVAFAFKRRSSDPGRVGFNNTVRVWGNLVRAHAFENNYQGRTVHNGFWKWEHEGQGPRIDVRNNVFLAFDPPPVGSTLFPYVTRVSTCQNNELLFAGSEAEWAEALVGACDDDGDDGLCDGERMLALSHCYTVITKSDSESEADFLATHWDPLVAAWKAEHSADDE